MNTVEIIRLLSNLSPIIPIIFILAMKRDRFKFKPINLVGLLLLVSGLTDLATYLMGLNRIDTAIVSNLYTLAEFILLSFLYKELLHKYKNIINWIMTLFVIFFILDTWVIEGISVFQSYTLTIEALVMVIYSMVFLIQYLRGLNAPQVGGVPSPGESDVRGLDEELLSARNYSSFWLNAAVFFYFMMDIYLFSVSRFVFTEQSTETAMMFWGFHNFCNTVKNLVFAVGIYYSGEKETQWSV